MNQTIARIGSIIVVITVALFAVFLFVRFWELCRLHVSGAGLLAYDRGLSQGVRRRQTGSRQCRAAVRVHLRGSDPAGVLCADNSACYRRSIISDGACHKTGLCGVYHLGGVTDEIHKAPDCGQGYGGALRASGGQTDESEMRSKEGYSWIS